MRSFDQPEAMCIAGGIDEMLEWSKTVARRTQKRPEEKSGDFDDQVREPKGENQ